MIQFCNPPTDALDTPKVLRVQPGSPLRVWLLCKNYVGCNTHWYGGHTVACPMNRDCKACNAGLMPEWGGFIFVSGWQGGKVAMLALTPVVAANLTLMVLNKSGLLGMKVTLARKTKAANSNILTTFHGFDPEAEEQPVNRLVARVRVLFKDYDLNFPNPAA